MGVSRIHLQEHGRTCTAQDTRFFALLSLFFADLLHRAVKPENHTWSHNHEKTLTVPEVLFRRESVWQTMHGGMERMWIKQYTFCASQCNPTHLWYTITHIGPLEESETSGRGHHRRTGETVDLVVSHWWHWLTVPNNPQAFYFLKPFTRRFGTLSTVVCLLWIDKTRDKYKTYICHGVSVWYKTKN